jgi:hypothetical protein
MEYTPMTNAKTIIPHSTQALARKPKPSSGKLVNNTGTIAQCIAHRVEAVIPMLSSRADVFWKSMCKYKLMQHNCINLYVFLSNFILTI